MIMKTRLLIIIGIITTGIIIALTFGTLEYQIEFNQNCHDDNGKVTGFLTCMSIREDFAEPQHVVSDPSLVEGTEIQLEGVIMDMRLGPDHQYSFFTNDPHYVFNTDSDGITLEGINKDDDLHGKIVKLSGTRTERDLGIKVNELVVLDSLIPKENSRSEIVHKVSLDELTNNPDKYYNQTIFISGQLEEYETGLAYAGVGCNTAKYTTSDEFVSDFPSSRHLYDGDKRIGVRIGTSDDLGKVNNPLPDELKINKVIMIGVFVPNVVNSGMCEHIIHKSGYLLTKLEDIHVILHPEPEPERTSEDEMKLADAKQKLEEIYALNSSFGPFKIQDVIVGYGIVV